MQQTHHILVEYYSRTPARASTKRGRRAQCLRAVRTRWRPPFPRPTVPVAPPAAAAPSARLVDEACAWRCRRRGSNGDGRGKGGRRRGRAARGRRSHSACISRAPEWSAPDYRRGFDGRGDPRGAAAGGRTPSRWSPTGRTVPSVPSLRRDDGLHHARQSPRPTQLT